MSLLRDWVQEKMLLKFTSPVYFDFSNVILWTWLPRSTYFGQYWFIAKYVTGEGRETCTARNKTKARRDVR